jgi:hypothetical protein
MSISRRFGIRDLFAVDEKSVQEAVKRVTKDDAEMDCEGTEGAMRRNWRMRVKVTTGKSAGLSKMRVFL